MSATIEFKFTCPKCREESDYGIDIDIGQSQQLKCYGCGYIVTDMKFTHFEIDSM